MVCVSLIDPVWVYSYLLWVREKGKPHPFMTNPSKLFNKTFKSWNRSFWLAKKISCDQFPALSMAKKICLEFSLPTKEDLDLSGIGGTRRYGDNPQKLQNPNGPVTNIYILILGLWKRKTKQIYKKKFKRSISRPLIGREDCSNFSLSTKGWLGLVRNGWDL